MLYTRKYLFREYKRHDNSITNILSNVMDYSFFIGNTTNFVLNVLR